MIIPGDSRQLPENRISIYVYQSLSQPTAAQRQTSQTIHEIWIILPSYLKDPSRAVFEAIEGETYTFPAEAWEKMISKRLQDTDHPLKDLRLPSSHFYVLVVLDCVVPTYVSHRRESGGVCKYQKQHSNTLVLLKVTVMSVITLQCPV